VTDPNVLPFKVERSIWIAAPADLVFRYFTDSARFASWWGRGSAIDARPGGEVVIHYPGGVIARGQVVSLEPPKRIVFTYGYDDPAKPIRPGESRVTVTLDEERKGTRLRLRHDIADATTRDSHAPGWRYQLSLFANIVTREAHGGAAELADRWFAVWNEPDAARRRAELESFVEPDVVFHDGFACVESRDDLLAHIEASRMFMPGMILARNGDPGFCQGAALVEWIVRGPDGAEQGRGANVFVFSGAGTIAGATGFWKG